MIPATIIREAQEDGVKLFLSPAGTLTASGDYAAVGRWLPAIRDNKPSILMELQRERRRAKVLSMLEGQRFALFVEDDRTDPVIATIGIRDIATFELAIPRHFYDGMVLLEFIEKHYGENYANT